MKLHLLQETPNVSIFYDLTNQWLFVDWYGDLTLPLVQESCLLVAKRFLECRYTRILNSNTGVTSMDATVPLWLAQEFLPYLRLAGVERVAWVYSPNLKVRCYTNEALYRAEVPMVTLFDDLEEAFASLQNAAHFNLADETAESGPEAQHYQLKSRVRAMSTALAYGRAAQKIVYRPSSAA